ncbi:MAG: hemerythrin family protein [Pseudomonadota bacterium]
MEILTWSDAMAVGVPEIDDAHRVLIGELARLQAGPDRDLPSGVARLLLMLEADFQGEEALMTAIAYPDRRQHCAQHARVLESFRQLAPGDCASMRRLLALMPRWFCFHLTGMDRALALAAALAGHVERQGAPA